MVELGNFGPTPGIERCWFIVTGSLSVIIFLLFFGCQVLYLRLKAGGAP